MSAKKLTIANIGNGNLMAMVERELQKVCENIADPAVAKNAKRKISVELNFKPDKKGTAVEIAYAVKSTLPGPDKDTTTAWIAMAPGSKELEMFSYDIRQGEMFPAEPLVSEIKPAGTQGGVVESKTPTAIASPAASN